MIKIDAHQHFWKYDPVRDSWIDDHMTAIRRDFLPADLKPLLTQNTIAGSIVVQSDQSENENLFQLSNAFKHDFIKGVVGWVDFTRNDIDELLQEYAAVEKLKGFRHILQGESDRAFMLGNAFQKGIGSLKKLGFTYDILVFQDQLQYVNQFVRLFPDQPFVLDHIGKPNIAQRDIESWKKEIKELTKNENVYCKISGLVTEANWKNWTPDDFKPYLDVVVANFGISRIMYGSDWPVCLLAASYEQTIDIVESYFRDFSINEQEMFFGGNAVKFYKL
jgi:L-fuconolactonase